MITRPRISLIMLNYNSRKILDIVCKSLDNIALMDLPIELVIVDNNSTDGSYEEIIKYINRKKLPHLLKFIKLKKNLYYTGGNNIGYLISNRRSKYVVFLNNDLVPSVESLELLINFLEKNKNVGAVQGVIHDINYKVQTAGFICDEFLHAHVIKDYPERPIPITYASGAYLVIRREVIERIGLPFYWEGYMYFDDWPLGYRVWSLGYKVISVPVFAGLHLGASSFGINTPNTIYFMYRGLGIMIELSNSRFKKLVKFTIFKELPLLNPLLLRYASSGLLNGLRTGRHMRIKKITINIYSAPILKAYKITSFWDAILPQKLSEKMHKIKFRNDKR